MADNDKQKCFNCRGTGKVSETRTEQDTATGVALGVALGMGYFPMTRTVTEEVRCSWCFGTGKR